MELVNCKVTLNLIHSMVPICRIVAVEVINIQY